MGRYPLPVHKEGGGGGGDNILPSSMDNKSVLVLCLVVGVMSPVSPIFLIASVNYASFYIAPTIICGVGKA